MWFVQLLLMAVGASFAAYMMFRANAVPPNTPWFFGILIAASVGSGVGIVVTAASSDLLGALRFIISSIATFAGQCAWLKANGYPIFFRPQHPLRGSHAKRI